MTTGDCSYCFKKTFCPFSGRLKEKVGNAGRYDPLLDLAYGASKLVVVNAAKKTLSIGDRIRVFCDDGVVVAEKISQTQFKEIHVEMMAELVH